MKGVLFFIGTAIRAMILNPSKFFYFHGYIIFVYLLTYLAHVNSLDTSRLIFTLGVTGPFILAIYNGLPLDCLDYEKAINNEIENNKN